mmetsp:Transcript_19893/g.55423  ORF Transcript_19893/g.55423 Transcript_19893/m.55423 type:complete len:91 (+) Transcript_19893:862-1134(+)
MSVPDPRCLGEWMEQTVDIMYSISSQSPKRCKNPYSSTHTLQTKRDTQFHHWTTSIESNRIHPQIRSFLSTPTTSSTGGIFCLASLPLGR